MSPSRRPHPDLLRVLQGKALKKVVPYTQAIGSNLCGMHALHFLACARSGVADIKKPDEHAMRQHIVRGAVGYTSYCLLFFR